MRILHLTDTHLGVDRPVRGGPRGWSRADDHLAALAAALADAEACGVTAIVHSGDLFDRSRPPRRAVLEAERLLRAAARWTRVLVIPGNHDRRGLERWLPVTGLEVFDRPARVAVDGLALGLVPFQPTAARFAAAAAPLAGVDVLVVHQAVDGAAVPGLVFRAGVQRDTLGPEHLPPGIGRVWCGHLHPRQVVRLGAVEVVHPGAAERTSWSERAQPKGWARWDFAPARATWRFVDGPTRPMVDVDGPEDLARVTPGALVRARGVPEAEIVARGGLLDGPPPGSARRPHPPPVPAPTLFAGTDALPWRVRA